MTKPEHGSTKNEPKLHLPRNNAERSLRAVLFAARRLLVTVLLSSHFLVALHVFSVMGAVLSYMQAEYIRRTFQYIVHSATTPAMSKVEKAAVLLYTTHTLLKPRHDLFHNRPDRGLREQLFDGADFHLIEARGNCGAYTHVLAGALQAADIDVRIAQMVCDGAPGCHIILEAELDGHWVAMDGFYNLMFKNADGSPASFRQVSANWDSFRSQAPAHYDLRFDYDDVRYTNWDKIPVVMPAARAIVRLFMGDRVDEFSLRAYFLNLYDVYAKLFFGLWLLTMTLTVLRWRGLAADRRAAAEQGRERQRDGYVMSFRAPPDSPSTEPLPRPRL